MRDRSTAFRVVALLLAVMWVSEIADAAAGGDLDALGIEPRDPDGLPGIALAPFLHAGFGHLLANSFPFGVLGAVIALGGAARVLLVTLITAVVSGLGVWLTAPENSVTLGASGVVFGFATYLIARGFFARSLLQLAVGVVIALLFGGTLLFGLVPRTGVSWQAHLFGAIGGVVAARLLSGRGGAARSPGSGPSPRAGLPLELGLRRARR